MLDYALYYARRGWQVFALAPGQKIPRKGTRGVLDATTDEDVIANWWRAVPDANIGIACGAASDLLVIDIDPRHDGDKSFEALKAIHGDVPPTVAVATGGGGDQLYFRHVDGLSSGAGRLGKGIDHRGTGGYVVAPPSLHPSGNTYQFYEDATPDIVAPADCPQWIIEGLRKETARRQAGPPDYYRDLFAKGAKEGERNDALVKMAGHLIRKRLDPFLVLDILTLWNDHRLEPPGDRDKLVGIVDRIAGRELERITKRRG